MLNNRHALWAWLSMISVALTDDKDLLWAFVKRYAPDTSPETHPEFDALIEKTKRAR